MENEYINCLFREIEGDINKIISILANGRTGASRDDLLSKVSVVVMEILVTVGIVEKALNMPRYSLNKISPLRLRIPQQREGDPYSSYQ